MTCWLTYWLLCLPTRWPIDWLTGSITNWLTDCVADRLLALLAYNTHCHKSLKQNPFFLNFLENFLYSLFSPLFSLKCVPLLPQCLATHILEHWDYCNIQINIGEEGKSYKCFKICDKYCSSLTNLLDWLAILRFMLRKGINFNALLMWIKITAIADENDWLFISDQICPADVSRLQQPRFWAYLQYCKYSIDCFVIQLLSEPDKLKSCSLL